jgi:hypothetical protein
LHREVYDRTSKADARVLLGLRSLYRLRRGPTRGVARHFNLVRGELRGEWRRRCEGAGGLMSDTIIQIDETCLRYLCLCLKVTQSSRPRRHPAAHCPCRGRCQEAQPPQTEARSSQAHREKWGCLHGATGSLTATREEQGHRRDSFKTHRQF